jgi:transposase
MTGASRFELARIFSVGPATAYRLVTRARETNSVEPTMQARPSTRLISDDALDAVRALVAEKSDRTLPQLVETWAAKRIGVVVRTSTMHRAIVRAGLSRKKSRSVPASDCGPMSSRSATPSAQKSKTSRGRSSSFSTRPA